ncbi:MAG: rRNA maturation RNase YbeY [Candidatus Paceibacteria bacterium]
MECNIFIEVDQPIVGEEEISSIVNQVFKQLDQTGLVSVHQIGDDKMRELNREYRDKDSTTDVLSFSMQEGDSFSRESKDYGDIFISAPQVKRQAKEYGVSPTDEFKRMLVHGVLHLSGYDHKQNDEAEEMYSLQEDLLDNISV